MYKINLIGDISSESAENVISYSLLSEELSKANGQDLEIMINTYGGEVDEAFKIYDLIENYKKENKARVTTITNKNCASSGVILLLAGSSRVVNNNSSPFVHNAWTNVYGANSHDLKAIAEDLENCDLKIAELYSRKTALSIEEALQLMNQDTEITPEEAYELGFATEISKVYNKKKRSVSLIVNKLNSNNMAEEKQSLKEKLLNFVNGLFEDDSKTEEKEEQKIENKIVLTVADEEIDFFELDSDATPTINDKATIGGQPANGDYKVKGGLEYKFEGGILKEIEEEREEEVIDEKVIELENQLTEAQNKIESLSKESEEKDLKIQNLQTELENSKLDIEKFNKLESEIKNSFKEQRESKQVEQRETFDFKSIGASIKQINNKRK